MKKFGKILKEVDAWEEKNGKLYFCKKKMGKEYGKIAWRKSWIKGVIGIMWPKLVHSAPINSRLNVLVRSSTPFGLGRNGCWPSRGFQLPQTFPFIFLLCCPLNNRTRAAHSFFKIGHLFSLSLFFCPSLARLRLLILLLLLMSVNVYPNLGLIFLA